MSEEFPNPTIQSIIDNRARLRYRPTQLIRELSDAIWVKLKATEFIYFEQFTARSFMTVQTRIQPCHWITRVLLLAMVVLFACPAVQADDTIKAPSLRQRQVGKIVADLMQRRHLSRRALDTEISNRAFDLYLNCLLYTSPSPRD